MNQLTFIFALFIYSFGLPFSNHNIIIYLYFILDFTITITLNEETALLLFWLLLVLLKLSNCFVCEKTECYCIHHIPDCLRFKP